MNGNTKLQSFGAPSTSRIRGEWDRLCSQSDFLTSPSYRIQRILHADDLPYPDCFLQHSDGYFMKNKDNMLLNMLLMLQIAITMLMGCQDRPGRRLLQIKRCAA